MIDITGIFLLFCLYIFSANVFHMEIKNKIRKKKHAMRKCNSILVQLLSVYLLKFTQNVLFPKHETITKTRWHELKPVRDSMFCEVHKRYPVTTGCKRCFKIGCLLCLSNNREKLCPGQWCLITNFNQSFNWSHAQQKAIVVCMPS